MKKNSRYRVIVGQLIRFGIVGVANTAVYYAFYRLLLLLFPYLVSHVLAWAVATIFSFYINAYFTFRKQPTLRQFFAFPASSLVNLVISTAVSALLVSGWDASANWGTVAGGIIAIPFTFAVMRLIFFSKILEKSNRDKAPPVP